MSVFGDIEEFFDDDYDDSIIANTNLVLKNQCKEPTREKNNYSFFNENNDEDIEKNVTAFDKNGNIVPLWVIDQSNDSFCIDAKRGEFWIPSFLVNSVKIDNLWYNVSHKMYFPKNKIQTIDNLKNIDNGMYVETFDGVDRYAGILTLAFTRAIRVGKIQVKANSIVGYFLNGIWYSVNDLSSMQWIPTNNKNDPLNKKRFLRVE